MIRLFALALAGALFVLPGISALAADVPQALARLMSEAHKSGDWADRALERFYSQRGHTPLWVGEDGRNAMAERMLRLMARAESQGLNPSDYMVPPSYGHTATDRARDERNISRMALRYAHHLSAGQVDPRQVGVRHQRLPQPVDPSRVLESLAAGTEPARVFSGLGPQDQAFQRLRSAYNRLQGTVAAGGWAPVPQGATLWPGDSDPRVISLRRTLWERGDLREPEAGWSPVYDESLERAVRRFQRRHGLDEDGAVGSETLGALNVSAAKRLDQLRVNLERRRWLDFRPNERHILVNVPAYETKVMRGHRVTLSSPVIVGSRRHQTPEISADMTHLVLNPYWYVPASIANEEMLPKLRKDPMTLAEQGFRAFTSWGDGGSQVPFTSIDWNAVSRMPVRLRQEPGPGNALGEVKFMFPNEDNIYLHDTPGKHLFRHTDRAFSHGCIRVARPIDLAEHLLQERADWDRQQILAMIESGERRTVHLHETIHVRIVYHTAWVDPKGVVHFRKDVYGRDGTLMQMLNPQA